MQWTTTGDRITLPYVAPEDDLQSTPATIKALAEAVVAELELATPVGAISPYMGDIAPDGWLMCDGSQYDPSDLPELYAVNAAFHASHPEFRVPDLRGRAPFGATDLGGRIYQWTLGERYGDKFTGRHGHSLQQNSQNNYHIGRMGTGSPINDSGGVAANNNASDSNFPFYASWYDQVDRPDSDWMYVMSGLAGNIPPGTGVNFIVYAGRSTAGINPVPGGEMPEVTTRDMIEARLAQAGIGEEEVKMLKEQLEELKRTEAK